MYFRMKIIFFFCQIVYNNNIGESMKLIFVVDSISKINAKINMMTNRFGNEIFFCVKKELLGLFKSYGHAVHAVYSRNLSLAIHTILKSSMTKGEEINMDSVVIFYSSLDIDDTLLNKFMNTIGDGQRIVNVMPQYNAFEKLYNSLYNVYVYSVFKNKDSMASPKLQYLPTKFVAYLLTSHVANKLFLPDPHLVKTIVVDNKLQNESLKVRTKFNHFELVPIILALLITIFLIVSLKFIGVNFILILAFVLMYLLDIVCAYIYKFKLVFDSRFFR